MTDLDYLDAEIAAANRKAAEAAQSTAPAPPSPDSPEGRAEAILRRRGEVARRDTLASVLLEEQGYTTDDLTALSPQERIDAAFPAAIEPDTVDNQGWSADDLAYLNGA